MMTETTQIEIEEINLNGQVYCLHLEIEYETEDEGIGPNEYWGASSVDCNHVKKEIGREMIEAFRLDENEELVEISGAEMHELLHHKAVSEKIERELEKECV